MKIYVDLMIQNCTKLTIFALKQKYNCITKISIKLGV